jgi:CBS domain-containing protein
VPGRKNDPNIVKILKEQPMKRRKGASSTEMAIIISCTTAMIAVTVASFGKDLFFPEMPFKPVLEDSHIGSVGGVPEIRPADPLLATSEPSGPFRDWSTWVWVISLGLTGVTVGWMYLGNRLTSRNSEQIYRRLLQNTSRIGYGSNNRLLEKRERIFRAFSANWSTILRESITAGDIMSPSPAAVLPDTPKVRVVAQMRRASINHLLVNDSKARLVGILSDRDWLKEGTKTAADMMTPNPLTVQVWDKLDTIISLIVVNRISCVPVLRGTEVVGVVTITDIAVTLQCMLALIKPVSDSPGAKRTISLKELTKSSPPADMPPGRQKRPVAENNK